MQFSIKPTPIQGLFFIEPQVFSDDRGFFFETFNADDFVRAGLPHVFLQDNHSRSAKGVLRGLHFQLPPKSMIKLVRCTRGKVWDVAVDLRRSSPTYKRWFGVELSETNRIMFLVPAGCAHGFYAFDDSEIQYKCSHTYDKALDANLVWNDPDIAIVWPLQGDPVLSDRDRSAPLLRNITLPF